MSDQIKELESLIENFALIHSVLIGEKTLAKDVIKAVDFVRSFHFNASEQLASKAEQAATKQDVSKVIDAQVVTTPSVGNNAGVAEV